MSEKMSAKIKQKVQTVVTVLTQSQSQASLLGHRTTAGGSGWPRGKYGVKPSIMKMIYVGKISKQEFADGIVLTFLLDLDNANFSSGASPIFVND